MEIKIKNDIKALDNSKLLFPARRTFKKQLCKDKVENDGSESANETYWVLFEKSKNPLLIIDSSFRFIKCNNAAVKILGALSKDEIINKPPHYFSPKNQPDGRLSAVKAAEMIRRAFKNRQHQFEWVHKRIDGVLLWIKVNLTAVPLQKEKILLVNWQNITENKKAEETIHKFYQAIEQTNEIIFMTSIEGKINFVNAAFEETYGYKREEVVGKVTPRILKSGLMVERFYSDLWKKLPAGKGIQNEIINKTKDGRLINIQMSVSPIFNEDKVLIGYMAVQKDITEEKKAEKKLMDAELQYRSLFEQSPLGICLVDYETLLPIDFNEQVHKQLGYSRKEFSKLKIYDYEEIEDQKAIKARVKKIIKVGHDNFVTRHKTKNGETRHVHVTVLKIMLHEVPVLYAIYQDITETVELTNTLQKQQMDLQRQVMQATLSGHEEEKNEIGRELHDNVNQLLATAKIYLGMIKNMKDEFHADLMDKSYNYLCDAMDEIRKLSHSLVSSVVTEKGLHECLNDFLQEFNSTTGVVVKLIYKIMKGRMLDPKLQLNLYRIIQEQLNNIRKHAQANKVLIHLRAKGDQLHLSIMDNGTGFDTNQKGNGIGLKNIQSRVEIYCGSMNIYSWPGEGCRLEVNIPLT